ncbi:MAG: protein kinase [archaeon]|nr:protein kinase [archaeon]
MQRVAEFQLGEVLGKGAFGVVYTGLSVSTGEMVAVKQIPLKEISAKELAALVSEVSLLSSLQHDNVVRLIRSVRTPETLNIIMEFIEGGSLLDVIKKFGGSVPETLLRSYVAQMLSGLAYLHQKGVVHRDIKAANLLITKAGQVKMADFGIAALDTDKSAPEHSFAGSPYWLAPEVILLEKARPQSDVWSMGCTILELLTGSPPYYHLNPLAAMHAMADDAKQVPVPAEACSPALQDFLAKCFTYDVAKRPTAQQLLQHAFVTGREYVPEQSSTAPAAAPVVVVGEVESQAVEAEDEDTEEEASESDLFSSEINACREICTWLTRALDKQRVKESHQLYEGLLPRAKSFLRAIKNKQNAKAETFKKVLIAVLDRYNREIEGAVEGFGKYDSGSESDSASHSVSSDGSETGSFDSDGEEDTDDLFRGSTFSLNNI